jgi:hypothetical protein
MLQIRDGASPEDFKAANATQQVTETSKNAWKEPWHKDMKVVNMPQMQNDNMEMKRTQDNL